MNFRFLKVQLFVVASTLSIAMLLFAAQRHEAAQPQFRSIVDLTLSNTTIASAFSRQTLLVAPAKVGGAWTVDSLPALRLVAPLAIIRAEHKNFPDSESLVTMDDVASYERTHGAISQGAIVLLVGRNEGATPILQDDALHFLIEARNVVGVGNAGNEIVSATQNSYLATKGIYQLENVANLSLLPHSGAIAVAAPQKIPGAVESPVRLMALLK
jgi:kynurenine formamidase